MELSVSILIASDRVDTLLPDCLRSLAAQEGGPAFEVVVCSGQAPREDGLRFPVRWAPAESRNPSHRRNLAARQSQGRILGFLDDDAMAESGWLAAGSAAIASAAGANTSAIPRTRNRAASKRSFTS